MLNPVVVLTDIMKEARGKDLKTIVKEIESGEWALKNVTSRLLTPPRSTPSPPSTLTQPEKKRIKTTWDPNIEYEVERILDCQKDENGRIWYLIKWKGWAHIYNTMELIDNLTSCHFKIMKYFESEKPAGELIKEKDKEIKESLKKHVIYNKLLSSNYKAKVLTKFSKKCMDISKLFGNSLKSFQTKVRREYVYIIRCLIAMSLEDSGLYLRAQNHRICLNLISLRLKQLRHNMRFEKRINTIEKTTIVIENNIDLDSFPKKFNYIVESQLGKNVVVPKDPMLGCECSEGCNSKSNCCGVMADSIFAYKGGTKLKLRGQIPIYECNSRCKCPNTCPNRVVQHGRAIKLCIFKTKSCGWGVKTLEKIKEGAFVCEYVGEIIHESEATVRDVQYWKQNTSYLFDLDFNSDFFFDMYCIDATKHGNIARFINHSCNPNLIVCPVWIDCLEPNLHRLAFFAQRNIEEGEEIYFDYENIQNSCGPNESDEDLKNSKLSKLSKVRCRCNSSNCRRWVFGNK